MSQIIYQNVRSEGIYSLSNKVHPLIKLHRIRTIPEVHSYSQSTAAMFAGESKNKQVFGNHQPHRH